MVFSSLQICNIVATTQVNTKIDLKLLCEKYDFIVNKPEKNHKRCNKKSTNKFSGAVARFQDPKSTCLLFSNGKIVCVGSKSTKEVKKTIDKLCKLILTPLVHESMINIQNVCGSFDYGQKMNLLDLYENLRQCQQVSFEPELFPGIKIEIGINNMIANVFRSGKVVITGASSIGKINIGYGRVVRIINSAMISKKYIKALNC